MLEVDPNAAGAQKGIKVGDVIIEVAQEAVSSLEDVRMHVDKTKKAGEKLSWCGYETVTTCDL